MPSLISAISATYIQWIKHEMQEKLEREHLQTITLNNEDFTWYEKDHEILVNGALFDIHAYSTKGNQSTFIGIFDKEESNMAMIAENAVSKHSESKHLAQIGGFFQLVQFLDMKEEQPIILTTLSVLRYAKNDFPHNNPFLSPSTPPPDFLLG